MWILGFCVTLQVGRSSQMDPLLNVQFFSDVECCILSQVVLVGSCPLINLFIEIVGCKECFLLVDDGASGGIIEMPHPPFSVFVPGDTKWA